MAPEGRRLYPTAARILITADGGGSNGWRLRLWKLELQAFADAIGRPVAVCHCSPGTSKWNKIELWIGGSIPLGRKVTALQMKQVTLEPDRFHGEWNYVIKPRLKEDSQLISLFPDAA